MERIWSCYQHHDLVKHIPLHRERGEGRGSESGGRERDSDRKRGIDGGRREREWGREKENGREIWRERESVNKDEARLISVKTGDATEVHLDHFFMKIKHRATAGPVAGTHGTHYTLL